MFGHWEHDYCQYSAPSTGRSGHGTQTSCWELGKPDKNMNGIYLKALENRAKKIQRAPDQTEAVWRVKRHREQLFPRSACQFQEKHTWHHEAESPRVGWQTWESRAHGAKGAWETRCTVDWVPRGLGKTLTWPLQLYIISIPVAGWRWSRIVWPTSCLPLIRKTAFFF